MAVVNKFNVNNKQVTLDADIIENMSANDVSYNSYTQYDENTVGDKLSKLEKEVIYDVSSHNNGVTFASLSALLSSENLSTLIPTSVRHGGMTIRFVQSSDNKYVQYRLMNETFSTTESDWQGVDYELTAGSHNLITSNGVIQGIENSLDVVHVKSYDIENSESELAISDTRGKVAFLLKDGNIKTKNFDSNEVNSNIDSINEKIRDVELKPFIDESGANSFAISDRNGNLVLQLQNGNIKTKNFDSTRGAESVVKIKALFIGNSVNQDHITYLPWLLKQTYGATIDFTIGIFYIGSYNIKQYVADVLSGNKKAEIWSIADNSEAWTNVANTTTLLEAINAYNWDIISMQGYFNTGVYYPEDITKLPDLVNWLFINANNPFKFGFLTHQTFEADVVNRIITNTLIAIENNPIEILFPCGFATEFAKADFKTSELTPDNIHAGEGLPCIMGSYVVLSVLSEIYGFPNKVLNNKNRITQAKYETLNIPGANGTLQTLSEDKWFSAQQSALKAVRIGKHIEDLASTNIYNSIND